MKIPSETDFYYFRVIGILTRSFRISESLAYQNFYHFRVIGIPGFLLN